MADNYSQNSSESDQDHGSDSEIEEESIWYLSQIKGHGLAGYQFEPRRSERGTADITDSSDDENSESEENNNSESEPPTESDSTDTTMEQSSLAPSWRDPDTFCKCEMCQTDTLQSEREALCCYSKELNLRIITNREG